MFLFLLCHDTRSPRKMALRRFQRKQKSIMPPVFFLFTLLITMSMQKTIILSVSAQANDALDSDPTNANWEYKANNNPENKFCGLSEVEAHAFCHLPPQQSLPCPNGAEVDCPYNMPCWTVTDPCTHPPTLGPSVSPTKAPITARSDDPTDHYFCGIGFDNLFDW